MIVSQVLFIFEVLIFLSVIFLHLSKKSTFAINLYLIQSLIVSGLLLSSYFKNPSIVLLLLCLAVLIVKVLIAPYFFYQLVNNNQLKFSASTYLNGPMTLVLLAIFTAFSYSHYLHPLSVLSPENTEAILLAVATMLASLFLIINRKGVLSQMIGLLSLENAIVSFAFLSGLEQSPGPQLGILFDILVWVIIATVFASMVYKQFGSLDVTVMKHLKEE